MNLSTAALRAAPGASILNAGLGKLTLDAHSAAGLQAKNDWLAAITIVLLDRERQHDIKHR